MSDMLSPDTFPLRHLPERKDVILTHSISVISLRVSCLCSCGLMDAAVF